MAAARAATSPMRMPQLVAGSSGCGGSVVYVRGAGATGASPASVACVLRASAAADTGAEVDDEAEADAAGAPETGPTCDFGRGGRRRTTPFLARLCSTRARLRLLSRQAEAMSSTVRWPST